MGAVAVGDVAVTVDGGEAPPSAPSVAPADAPADRVQGTGADAPADRVQGTGADAPAAATCSAMTAPADGVPMGGDVAEGTGYRVPMGGDDVKKAPSCGAASSASSRELDASSRELGAEAMAESPSAALLGGSPVCMWVYVDMCMHIWRTAQARLYWAAVRREGGLRGVGHACMCMRAHICIHGRTHAYARTGPEEDAGA